MYLAAKFSGYFCMGLVCDYSFPRTFEVIASEYRWELYKVVYGVLQIKVKA